MSARPNGAICTGGVCGGLCVEQDVFNGLMGELMYQQDLRQAILHLMRSPQRSDRLAAAFGQLLRAHTA